MQKKSKSRPWNWKRLRQYAVSGTMSACPTRIAPVYIILLQNSFKYDGSSMKIL